MKRWFTGRVEEAWGYARAGGRDRFVRARIVDGQIVLERALDAQGRHPARPSINTPPVVALVSDTAVRHERIELPALGGKKLRRALDRKRHALAGKGDGHEVSLTAVSERSTAYLAVTIPTKLAEAEVETLTARNLRPARLLTPTVALVSLLDRANGLRSDDHATVIVHLGDEVGSVGFVYEGQLLLGRAFRMPGAPEEPSGPGSPRTLGASCHENIIAEIGRSLLFFNHQLHGKPVGEIAVSSDVEGAEAILPACRERFRVPVRETLELLHLPAGAFQEDGCAPGRWVSAVAAAIAGLTRTPDVDLTPARVRGRRLGSEIVAGAAAVAVVASIGMAAFHVERIEEIEKGRDVIAFGLADLRALNEELALFGEDRALRIMANDRERFLAERGRSLGALAAALDAASGAARGEVRLERLALEPVEDAADATYSGADEEWDEEMFADGPQGDPGGGPGTVVARGAPSAARSLSLEGRAYGPDATAAHAAYGRFVERLSRSPLFTGAERLPVRVTPDLERGGAVLSFELRVPISEEPADG